MIESKSIKIKLIFLCIIVLISCIACQTFTLDGLPSNPPGEYLKPVFDGREWIMSNRSVDDYKSLTEYLPRGQTRNNWTESLGGTFFAVGHHNASIQRELDNFIFGIKSVCPQVTYHVISSSENELIYEWRISDCNNQHDQTELGRYIKSSHGLYRIAYVKKGPILNQAEREKWISLLSQAVLINIDKQN